jgi:hypothetical protein
MAPPATFHEVTGGATLGLLVTDWSHDSAVLLQPTTPWRRFSVRSATTRTGVTGGSGTRVSCGASIGPRGPGTKRPTAGLGRRAGWRICCGSRDPRPSRICRLWRSRTPRSARTSARFARGPASPTDRVPGGRVPNDDLEGQRRDRLSRVLPANAPQRRRLHLGGHGPSLALSLSLSLAESAPSPKRE